jgi:hypothetical protein
MGKAVSPFVAMVLIIAFTVTAGAIIVKWFIPFIRGYTERVGERAEAELECAEGAILIHDASIRCDLTATPDRLNFTLENTGKISLYEILAQVEVQAVVYGPYDVMDYLVASKFSKDFPLRPGYQRTVYVNLTDDLPAADASRLRVWTTRCPDVADEVLSVDCTP